MKIISIFGATFYGNRGAEAMLSTVIGEFQSRYGNDSRVHVFSYYPQQDRKLVSDPRILIHSATPMYLLVALIPLALIYRLFVAMRASILFRIFPASIRGLAESKIMICIAGVTFIQGRTKYLPYNVATLLPAIILGVPVIKLSQAMGPFDKQPNKAVAKYFLSRCKAVFARGESTLSYLTDLLGSSDNIKFADDLVFLFRPEYSKTIPDQNFYVTLSLLESAKALSKKLVGFCPSSVVAKNAATVNIDYIEASRRLIRCLADAGFTIVIYPNATRVGEPEKNHNNDLPLIESILATLGDLAFTSSIVFKGNLNAEQIQSVICLCDINIVSRFHAMVMSLATHVPLLVIGWSHKYAEVMSKFNQGDMVFDYSYSETERIVESASLLYDQRIVRSNVIGQALPTVITSAEKQFDFLFHLLSGSEDS